MLDRQRLGLERCPDAIDRALRLGYAHHIQRLMVTGLHALMLGVRPHGVHEGYLAVYVDAVERVELPNTLGMSQHGDGGIMASKPYVATGKYIQRMSNYCAGCRFDPAEATGREGVPVHDALLGFSAATRVAVAQEPAHGDAGAEPHTARRCAAQGDSEAGREDPQ